MSFGVCQQNQRSLGFVGTAELSRTISFNEQLEVLYLRCYLILPCIFLPCFVYVSFTPSPPLRLQRS